MPSNDSPAFDVLSASGAALCVRYGVNLAYAGELADLRDAMLAALQEPAPEAEREDATRFRWLLDRGFGFSYDKGEYGITFTRWGKWTPDYRACIDAVRLPAPKPAECRLSWHDAGYMKSHLANSDGKVLGGVRGTTSEWTAWVYGAGDIGQYIAESKAKRAVEAFAATRTEGADGR